MLWALFVAAPMVPMWDALVARAEIRMDDHAGKHQRESHQEDQWQGDINGIDDIRRSADASTEASKIRREIRSLMLALGALAAAILMCGRR